MKTYAKIGPLAFTNMVFNNLFDEILDEGISASKTFLTSKGVLYNILKKDNEFEIEFNIAGYSKDKVNIDVEDNELIVSYEDTQPEKEYYVFKTFPSKSFRKVFNLTDIDVKNIKASHEDGVLRIVLPKVKEKVSRRVEIV